jgi:hypothetical protein
MLLQNLYVKQLALLLIGRGSRVRIEKVSQKKALDQKLWLKVVRLLRVLVKISQGMPY